MHTNMKGQHLDFVTVYELKVTDEYSTLAKKKTLLFISLERIEAWKIQNPFRNLPEDSPEPIKVYKNKTTKEYSSDKMGNHPLKVIHW